MTADVSEGVIRFLIGVQSCRADPRACGPSLPLRHLDRGMSSLSPSGDHAAAVPTLHARYIYPASLSHALSHPDRSISLPALFSSCSSSPHAPVHVRKPSGWPGEQGPRTEAKVGWTEEKLMVWFRATGMRSSTDDPADQKTILKDSRVEIFLGTTTSNTEGDALQRYNAYEMNRSGRCMDFSVTVPKQFDYEWSGGAKMEAQWIESAEELAGEQEEIVNMLISIPWTDCDPTVSASVQGYAKHSSSVPAPAFHLGLHRGEARGGEFIWQSWRDIPATAVDFHVPCSFGRMVLEMPKARQNTDQPLCRRVTDSADVEHVQQYLQQHFPQSIKLYSLIQSWQQQLKVRSADDLIDPIHPRLWVSVPPHFPAASPVSAMPREQLDVVLLSYGPENTDKAIASAVAALPSQSEEKQSKPPRPHIGIYVGHYARPESSDKLYNAIVECLPISICLQFAGCDAIFNPVLDRLASSTGGRLLFNPHAQWMKLPPGSPGREGVKFIAPSALTKEDLVKKSPKPVEAETSSSIVVAPLRLEHASMVDHFWPYRSAASPPIIAWLIDRLPSTCVYVDGTPVSWVLAQCYGGIGMLHTMEQHRGKGYARLAVDALCAKLFEEGRSAFCYIGNKNVPSQKTFHSLGFRPTHYMDWTILVAGCYDTELQGSSASPKAH
jgi:hypothetical protein